MSGREQRFSTTTRSASSRAAASSRSAGRFGGADGEPVDQPVDGAVAGHGDGGEPELAQGPLPLGGFDGHPVGTAESEGEEGGGRNGVTVVGPGRRRFWPTGVPGRDTVVRCPKHRSQTHPLPAAGRSGSDLLAERRGPVLTLTINRPERRNAMTWEVIGGLREQVARAKDDPAVRVVVLAGAGDQAFCAGADLSGMVPRSDPGGVTDEYADHHLARGWLAELFEELWHLGKPTIARVQGWAMAGGFGLALACDMVIASEQARFGAPELNVGLWPYMVTVPMLRSMPPKKALELMLTSRVVGAEEAERIGFVTRVVPADRLDAEVAEMAAVLASKPPGVMRMGRESFYAVLDSAATEALPYLHAMLTVTSQTAEAAEGIAAFTEKRPPAWQAGTDDTDTH